MPTSPDRRWPDRETRRRNIEEGRLDDSMDAVPMYDLEDWEVSGERIRRSSTPTRHALLLLMES
jgi:hypothetical protein